MRGCTVLRDKRAAAHSIICAFRAPPHPRGRSEERPSDDGLRPPHKRGRVR